MAGERDVLIVGAGMAGLACAERLARADIDFLVVEGANRVGGRVLTDFDVAGGRPLEIGALMVHGSQVVTHRWIAEAGMHTRPLPLIQRARFWTGDRYVRFLRTSLPLRRGFGPRAFYQGVRGIPKAMQRYSGPDLSLGEFLDRERALPGARQLVTLLKVHAAAAEADEVGVRGAAEEEALAHEEFGYNNFQVVEGYSELAARRARPLGSRLRLGVRVTAVRRSSGGVVVEAQTSGGHEEFRAKRIVVTASLGTLKAGMIDFDPPLPEAKRRAIDALGFGHAMVVQMRFRGGNLFDRLGDFALLWGETASTFHRPYVGVADAPRALLAFTTGRAVPRRVGLADAEVVEETLSELRSILPAGVATGEVEAHAISRWSSDPLVRGGYSFLPVNVGVAARKALGEPVDGVLFFAGEATHAGGESGTVHGAIETGYRAADEILQSIRSGGDVPPPSSQRIT